MESTEAGPTETGFGLRNWLAAISVALVALFFWYLGVASSSNSTTGDYQVAYIYLNSFVYGVLAAITLILETAYDFDKYQRSVARMAPFVFFISATAMFVGLRFASAFLPERIADAFFFGLLFLFVGTSLA